MHINAGGRQSQSKAPTNCESCVLDRAIHIDTVSLHRPICSSIEKSVEADIV